MNNDWECIPFKFETVIFLKNRPTVLFIYKNIDNLFYKMTRGNVFITVDWKRHFTVVDWDAYVGSEYFQKIIDRLLSLKGVSNEGFKNEFPKIVNEFWVTELDSEKRTNAYYNYFVNIDEWTVDVADCVTKYYDKWTVQCRIFSKNRERWIG